MEGSSEGRARRNVFVKGFAAAREGIEYRVQGGDAHRLGDRGATGPAAAAASAEAVGSSWRNDVSRIIKKRKKGEIREAREVRNPLRHFQ